jgi:hypothetical protein
MPHVNDSSLTIVKSVESGIKKHDLTQSIDDLVSLYGQHKPTKTSLASVNEQLHRDGYLPGIDIVGADRTESLFNVKFSTVPDVRSIKSPITQAHDLLGAPAPEVKVPYYGTGLTDGELHSDGSLKESVSGWECVRSRIDPLGRVDNIQSEFLVDLGTVSAPAAPAAPAAPDHFKF